MRQELHVISEQIKEKSRLGFLFNKSSLVKTMEEECNKLNVQLDFIDQHIAHLDLHLTAKIDELANTEQVLSSTELVLSQTQENLETTSAKLHSTEKTLSETQSTLADTSANLEKTSAQLKSTKTELSQTKGNLESTSAKLHSTEKMLSETQSTLADTSANLEKTSAQLKKTETELSQTKGKLTATSEKLRSREKILFQTENDLNNTLAQLEQVEDILSSTENSLSQKAEELIAVSKELTENKSVLQDAELREKLLSALIINSDKKEKFNTLLKSQVKIAIGGGFSAGKSAFINSLFEDKTIKLASSIEPTTAIPMYVIKGSKTELFAENKSNEAINLSRLDPNFQSKLSHKFMSNFSFNLKEVIPALLLKTPIKFEHLCFIDTPGYNPASSAKSFTHEDMATAINFIAESDALLWLIGADVTGTVPKSDLDFLEKVLEKSPNLKIYFVLNKADLRPPSQIEEIVQEIEEVLGDYGIENNGISAYSSVKRKEISYHNQSLFDFLQEINSPPPPPPQEEEKIKGVRHNFLEEALKRMYGMA